MLKEFGGSALVIFALLIAFAEVGLHLYAAINHLQYEASKIMLLIAAVIGFVGMYILDPRRAKDGGKFIIDSAVRVVQVIRNGRRKEDAMNVTVEDSSGHTADIVVPTIPDTDVPKPVVIDPATKELFQRRTTDSQEASDGKRD